MSSVPTTTPTSVPTTTPTSVQTTPTATTHPGDIQRVPTDAATYADTAEFVLSPKELRRARWSSDAVRITVRCCAVVLLAVTVLPNGLLGWTFAAAMGIAWLLVRIRLPSAATPRRWRFHSDGRVEIIGVEWTRTHLSRATDIRRLHGVGWVLVLDHQVFVVADRAMTPQMGQWVDGLIDAARRGALPDPEPVYESYDPNRGRGPGRRSDAAPVVVIGALLAGFTAFTFALKRADGHAPRDLFPVAVLLIASLLLATLQWRVKRLGATYRVQVTEIGIDIERPSFRCLVPFATMRAVRSDRSGNVSYTTTYGPFVIPASAFADDSRRVAVVAAVRAGIERCAPGARAA